MGTARGSEPGGAGGGRRIRRWLAAVAGAVLVAACGKTGAAPTGSAPATSPSPSANPALTVAAAPVAGLGTVLVNGDGRTLYALTSEHGTLVCISSACLQAWPAIGVPSAGSAMAGSGVQPGLLGAAGSSGAQELTYAGWPLHTFSGDAAAGQAAGQGIVSFGGTWEVVTTAGSLVAPPSPSPPAPTARTSSPPIRPLPAVTRPAAVPTTPGEPTTPAAAPTTPAPAPTYSSTYGYGY